MAKSKEMLKARQLRREGESIKVIAKNLKVSVSSASLWCKDISLTKEQIQNLQKRSTDPYYGKKAEYLIKKKEEFEKKVQDLKQKGIQEIGNLSEREIFLIGIALYWGEGFKKDHQVGFATSDPKMAKFFILWINKCFHISNEHLILRVTANESYKDKIKNIEKFWSDTLKIYLDSFSKPYFQKTVWKKQYENANNYHGVIRIKVRKSIDLLRKIYGFIEGISLNISDKSKK